MSYHLEIKEPAERWLKKYTKEIQRRFAKKILKLENFPEKYGKPLRAPLAGYWEM